MPPISKAQPLVVFENGYYLSSNIDDANSVGGVKVTSLKQDPLQKTLIEYRDNDIFWSGFEKFLDDYAEYLG